METAMVLKVSPDTVMRDSRLAKAWLCGSCRVGLRIPVNVWLEPAPCASAVVFG